MKFLYLSLMLVFFSCANSTDPNPIASLVPANIDAGNDATTKTLDGGEETRDMGSTLSDMSDVKTEADTSVPPVDILVALQALENIDKVKELSAVAGKRRFLIDFRQNLNHNSAQSPTFIQQGVLTFVGYEAPTVLVATGYGLPDPERFAEFPVGATDILDANQLLIGHRFYTGALPAPQDQKWEYLTIEESAKDTHSIITSMRKILSQSWIGTGWSKGGMTIIFQEFHFPDDIDLALPMVAPITFGMKDARYPPFLAQIGTPFCRKKLDESMLGALDRKLELADVFGPSNDTERQQWATQVRYSIVTFIWTYWQYYGESSCTLIPPGNADAQDLVSFFVFNELPKLPQTTTSKPRPIDAEEAGLIAYTYQSLNELGFQDSYPTGHLQRMVNLGHLSPTEKDRFENGSSAFGDYPWEGIPPFIPQKMVVLDQWLRSDAQNMIAVYGEYDPWTAGKVTLNSGKKSKVYIVPKASHGAFLADLKPADLQEISSRLLEFDNRNRVRSLNKLEVNILPKPTAAQRRLLLQLLRNEL